MNRQTLDSILAAVPGLSFSLGVGDFYSRQDLDFDDPIFVLSVWKHFHRDDSARPTRWSGSECSGRRPGVVNGQSQGDRHRRGDLPGAIGNRR